MREAKWLKRRDFIANHIKMHNPDWTKRFCRMVADRAATRMYGPRPMPDMSWTDKLRIRLSKVKTMDFSWLVALWKGVRDAFLAALPAALAGLLLVVFEALEAADLVTYGVPLWLVPLLVGLFTALRNVLRNKFGLPV